MAVVRLPVNENGLADNIIGIGQEVALSRTAFNEAVSAIEGVMKDVSLARSVISVVGFGRLEEAFQGCRLCRISLQGLRIGVSISV